MAGRRWATSTSSTSARIPTSPNRASLRHVLTITRPSALAGNHNGGQLQFGRDGFLYISVGDGGTGGSTAPNLGLLNGKILRIDPHGATPGAYSIPAGNPYATSGSDRHEIWASGFRNPWRFSFDAATGDLVIGDVGEGAWEEIDLAPAAGHRTRRQLRLAGLRGLRRELPGDDPSPSSSTRTATRAETSRTAARSWAATSTAGTQIPALAGRYLYADLCTGELRSIKLGIPFAAWRPCRERSRSTQSPQSFGEDASCNLYVTNGDVVDKIVGSGPGRRSAQKPAKCKKARPARSARSAASTGKEAPCGLCEETQEAAAKEEEVPQEEAQAEEKEEVSRVTFGAVAVSQHRWPKSTRPA